MFDFSSFGDGVIGLIQSLVQLYLWVIIIRVLISWINPDPNNSIVRFLRGMTDPVIDRLRSVLPQFFWSTGLDFTPLILIVLLQVVLLFLQSLRLN